MNIFVLSFFTTFDVDYQDHHVTCHKIEASLGISSTSIHSILNNMNNVYMSGMAIAKSETLDVLGTSIRSDLRWDDHVFNVSKEAAKCLGFLKRCKKSFTPSLLSMLPILDRKWNTIHMSRCV